MNGVDVTDVSRNYTVDKWAKLKDVGGHTYVYSRRDFLNNRGSGRFDGRGGGRGGRGRGGSGRATDNRSGDDTRSVAAATTTDIVEYKADSSNTREPTHMRPGIGTNRHAY